MEGGKKQEAGEHEEEEGLNEGKSSWRLDEEMSAGGIGDKRKRREEQNEEMCYRKGIKREVLASSLSSGISETERIEIKQGRGRFYPEECTADL